MPDSSDQRALATRLPGLSDARLREAFAARGVAAHAPWQDWFDAAEALLEPAAIDRVLPRLPREALRALAEGSRVDDPLARAALLVDDDGFAYPAVAERIRRDAVDRSHAYASVAAPPPPSPAGATESAAAAERVFATVGALADLLLAATDAPLTRTGAGAVSAVDRRRLVESGVVETAEELERLVTAAESAGLLDGGARESAVTPAAEAWLPRSTAQRWAEVVVHLRSALPPPLRTADGGYLAPDAWAAVFPLDPEWPTRADLLAQLWREWGLLAVGGAEPAWATPLRSGSDPDVAALARELPPEIDKVYLQADLSAIAPGPLAPALDLRLRRLAHRESRAQASTYRFSADSIGAALTHGETADSARAFLAQLSLTGIPQPLDYLLTSVAARHGSVTVRTDPVTGRSIVESDDDALRATIAVDQALRPLGLVPEGRALVSRVSRDVVARALAEARYPVLTHDDQEPSLRRETPPAGGPAPEPYERLIATLRASGSGDTDAAWLERELELAVRARAVVTIEVRLPDDTTRSFTLEASGLGGGRLRGRDRASDVERTLPVSSIVSVRAAKGH